MPRINATNLYSTTPYIVDLAASQGSFTTIQSAIDAAFAAGGGFVAIKKGNYVENLVLRNNVALMGMDTDARAPLADLVLITGNHTLSGVGECIVQCIHFVSTAGDTFTVDNNVGGNALVLGFKYCLFDVTGGRAISLVDTSGTGFCIGVFFSSQVNTDGDCIFLGDRSQFQIQENSSLSSNTGSVLNLSGVSCGAACFYSDMSSNTSTILINQTGVGCVIEYCTIGSSSYAYEFASAGQITSYHNTIGVTGVANDYIGGAAAGVYQYCDEALTGATGISGTVNASPVTWKPFATDGNSGTAIRGTAGFDSTDFSVTDGFVSLVSSGAYISLDPYIVGQVGDTHAGFTSVNAAITQAVADGHGATNPANIYVKPGFYTEDVAMFAGINIIGFSPGFNASFFSANLVPETAINGVITADFAGQAFIKSISLNGTTGAAIVISTGAGPEPTVLNIENCYLSATLAPTIVHHSDNSVVTFYDCFVQQEGIFGFFNKANVGQLTFERCTFQSLNGTVTSNAVSDGSVELNYSRIESGIVVTGTGNFKGRYSEFYDDVGLAIDTSSSATATILHCTVSNNIGASVNVAFGSTLQAFACSIYGSASPEITGAGTLQYDHIFGVTALGTLITVVNSTLPISGTTLASRGHAWFNGSDFTVDADGQVHSNGTSLPWFDYAASSPVVTNSGSFILPAGVTMTLPAAPPEGTVQDFVVAGGNPGVIQVGGTDLIQIGSATSSVGGNATSTANGDSLHLVYRTGDSTWYSVGGAEGTWILA